MMTTLEQWAARHGIAPAALALAERVMMDTGRNVA